MDRRTRRVREAELRLRVRVGANARTGQPARTGRPGTLGNAPFLAQKVNTSNGRTAMNVVAIRSDLRMVLDSGPGQAYLLHAAHRLS